MITHEKYIPAGDHAGDDCIFCYAAMSSKATIVEFSEDNNPHRFYAHTGCYEADKAINRAEGNGMTTTQAASTLEDLLREQYPQAVVTLQGTKFIALTGTEPGDRTEFEAPEGPMTFPHAYAIAQAVITEWDSRKASNPYA